jgi:hypothetical protein
MKHMIGKLASQSSLGTHGHSDQFRTEHVTKASTNEVQLSILAGVKWKETVFFCKIYKSVELQAQRAWSCWAQYAEMPA